VVLTISLESNTPSDEEASEVCAKKQSCVNEKKYKHTVYNLYIKQVSVIIVIHLNCCHSSELLSHPPQGGCALLSLQLLLNYDNFLCHQEIYLSGFQRTPLPFLEDLTGLSEM
jgi:hypothetical protein